MVSNEIQKIADENLFPVKKFFTNKKYNFDSHKTEINIEQLLTERRLFTFFGTEINSFELSNKDIKTNFENFFKSVKWFSYRQNMKGLQLESQRQYHTDASKILYFFI